MIISHGRPNSVDTLATIRRCGYTGEVIIVLDNEDETIEQYRANFPDDEIVVFDKRAVVNRVDAYTNSKFTKSSVFARNACFDIAAERGIEHFVQLDDDYTGFEHRIGPDSEYLTFLKVRDLDGVFEAMIEFLEGSGAASVAFSQGGDLMGAQSGMKKQADGTYTHIALTQMRRKVMNSFFFRTDRPVEFCGLMNEDVNAYVTLGRTGHIFATVGQAKLVQRQTQTTAGGMSDIYAYAGTYAKSFYTIIANPSCVKIGVIGAYSPRIHHSVEWKYAVPKILNESHAKHANRSQGRKGGAEHEVTA